MWDDDFRTQTGQDINLTANGIAKLLRMMNQKTTIEGPLPICASSMHGGEGESSALSLIDVDRRDPERRDGRRGIHTRGPRDSLRANAHSAPRNGYRLRARADRTDVDRHAECRVCLLLPIDAVRSPAKSRRCPFRFRTHSSLAQTSLLTTAACLALCKMFAPHNGAG